MENHESYGLALGLEASTRYFDVLHFLFEHFISIFNVSDFFLPLLQLTR